jgi:hypothetical protein
MTELVPLHLSQIRLNATGDAVRALKAMEQAARPHADVEFLAADAVTTKEDVRRLWAWAWELAAEGGVRDFRQTGEQLRAISEKVITAMRELIDLVREREQLTGRSVRALADLERAVQETRRWVDEALASWPWPDRPWPKLDADDLRKAREQFARGECEDPADVLARLGSGGPLIKE